MLSFLLAASTDLFADPLLLVALAAATSITALSYVAGEFFSMASLRAFAKGEARELLVTGIIVLLAMVLLLPDGLFDTVASGFAPQQQKFCPEWKDRQTSSNKAFGLAGYFVGCKWTLPEITLSGAKGIADIIDITGLLAARIWTPGDKGVLMPRLVSAYWELMKLEIYTGMLSTLAFGISLPGALGPFPINLDVGGIYFFSFLAPINEANTVLVDIVGALVSTIAAHKMLLDFFEINIPAVMLPLGLAARAFPFTRKTGSTIVAFCFAAYFVFPTTVLLNQRIYDMIQNPPCAAGKLEAGKACSAAAECCSGLCRAGKCVAPLTDFSEYGSTYAICQDSDLKNKAAELETILKDEEEKERKMLQEVQANQLKSGVTGGLTDQKIEDYLKWKEKQNAILSKYLGQNNDVTFTTPSAAWGLVGVFESATSDVAGLTVLVSLFVVNEIIFTLTLFRDFSLLIGGEARLFGLSKMV